MSNSAVFIAGGQWRRCSTPSRFSSKRTAERWLLAGKCRSRKASGPTPNARSASRAITRTSGSLTVRDFACARSNWASDCCASTSRRTSAGPSWQAVDGGHSPVVSEPADDGRLGVDDCQVGIQGGHVDQDLMSHIGHDDMRAALICQRATSDADKQVAAKLSDLVDRHRMGTTGDDWGRARWRRECQPVPVG